MSRDRAALRDFYSRLLFDGILPFWFEHGVDRELGGVMSCMTEEGDRTSTDKYLWSQGRWLWLCARIHNRLGARPEMLESARKTAEFLLRHGRDPEGRWYFAVSREGEPRVGPVSVFSDCFAIYGLGEYYRAVQDPAAIEAAIAAFRRVRARVDEPGFTEVAPDAAIPGRRRHSVPMILLEVANELAQTTGEREFEEAADEAADRILRHHVSPELGVVLEYLDWDYRPLPPGEGTAVEPGHAIESMWFLMHWARRRDRRDLIARAAEVMRWHIEKGWDPEFGGLFLGIDALGGEPYVKNATKKVWWPHTEALYGLILTSELLEVPWAEEWYQRIHDWSFSHFPLREGGEWRQRLDREGRPVSDLIALPVKDPFHLARAVILILEVLAGPGTNRT